MNHSKQPRQLPPLATLFLASLTPHRTFVNLRNLAGKTDALPEGTFSRRNLQDFAGERRRRPEFETSPKNRKPPELTSHCFG
ncbi:hypothetical protein HanIR_Chr11g0547301 [Helianthus annuus]|nr:hypothetical protein HanIR_Chr11g0547301 [Helianthus annuus]